VRVTPLPGVPAKQVREVLQDVTTRVANVMGQTGQAFPRHNDFLVWASEAVRSLSFCLRPAEIDRLICSPRYWVLESLDPASRSPESLAGLLNLEADAVIARLKAAISQLDAEIERWGKHPGNLVVLDTNVYCHNHQLFHETEWHEVLGLAGIHLVMPLVIVDELDRLKRVTEAKAGARATLKVIDSRLSDPEGTAEIRLPSGKAVTFDLLLDDVGHARMTRADDEIVDRALRLSALVDRAVTLVTFDTGARVRGKVAGLLVQQIDEPERTRRKRSSRASPSQETA
jgi:hypothetical protein